MRKEKIVGIFVMMLLFTSILPISPGLREDLSKEENKFLISSIKEKNLIPFKQNNLLNIEITKPKNFLYINDKEFFPFFIPLIIGSINIQTEITDGSALKVEFYIDNMLKFTDTIAPFSWKWDEKISFKHNIKVIAYDETNITDISEIDVFIFNRKTKESLNNIKLNELVYSTGNVGLSFEMFEHEWIEIFNPTSNSIDLDGWTISNRNATSNIILPSINLPSKCFLTIHQDIGINDLDFEDLDGHYYTGVNTEIFDDGEDECALYDGNPSASTIIDFIAWSDKSVYSPGKAYDYAVDKGIWNLGDCYDIGGIFYINCFARYFDGFDRDVSSDWWKSQWTRYTYDFAYQPENSIQKFPKNMMVIDDLNPTFEWYEFPDANYYNLQVDNNWDFSSPEIDESNLINTFYISPSTLSNEAYFYRVRAYVNGKLTSWTGKWLFVIETSSLKKSISEEKLSCPHIYQHKDTNLLCLYDIDDRSHDHDHRSGCEETGTYPWDAPHPNAPPPDPNVKRVHGTMYCVPTSITMINHFYGGDLNIDRVSYQLNQNDIPVEPEGDLGHDEGYGYGEPATGLSWALNGAAITVVANPTFDQIKGWVDSLDCFGAFNTHHMFVVDHYLDYTTSLGSKLKIVYTQDPWNGPNYRYVYEYEIMGVPEKWMTRHSTEKILCACIQPSTGVTARTQEASVWKDTDGDGVMDFDEENRFHTDKNDVDTDDDEVWDKQEIRSYTFHDKDTGHNNDALNFPDIDGDGLRAEKDCDSDDDSDFDGGEDIDGNGIAYKVPALETDVYNCLRDEHEIWIDVELVKIGVCLYEVYLIGQTFHANSIYHYEFSTICAKPIDGGPIAWTGTFSTDKNGIIIRQLIAIVSEGCYRVIADVLSDGLYSEPDNWDPYKLFTITCPLYIISYNDGYTENSLKWTDCSPWIAAIELSDPELSGYRDYQLTNVHFCTGCDAYGYHAVPYNIYYATGVLPSLSQLGTAVAPLIASGESSGTGWDTVEVSVQDIPDSGSAFVIVEWYEYDCSYYPAGFDENNSDTRGAYTLYQDTEDNWVTLADLGYPAVYGIDAILIDP